MSKLNSIIVLIVLVNTVYSQTMVMKKSDGSYTEVPITDAVELYYYTPCPGTPTVDYGGKTYNTVQIGDQCWLKENLDIGTLINSHSGGTNSDGNQTNNGLIEKNCYNNDEANCIMYGGLYQWNEAMQYVTTECTQGICPDSWHIPTLSEFETLKATVNNDANSLKAIGQGTDDGAGTNTSGFSALLNGIRFDNGYFGDINNFSYYWSSTVVSTNEAYNFDLGWTYYAVGIDPNSKQHGMSIRCIKN